MKIIHFGNCRILQNSLSLDGKKYQLRDYGLSWRFCYICAPDNQGSEDPPILPVVYASVQQKFCVMCWYSCDHGPIPVSERHYCRNSGAQELMCDNCIDRQHVTYQDEGGRCPCSKARPIDGVDRLLRNAGIQVD